MENASTRFKDGRPLYMQDNARDPKARPTGELDRSSVCVFAYTDWVKLTAQERRDAHAVFHVLIYDHPIEGKFKWTENTFDSKLGMLETVEGQGE